MKIKGLLTTVSIGAAMIMSAAAMAQTEQRNSVKADTVEVWTLDRCIEYAIKDKDVVLLNAFEDDFKNIKARRIIGNENILHYLEALVREPYKRDKPLYIVIDELLVCCMDKKINNAIKDLLAIGRHYNVFVIGIAQRGTKTDLSFKDLFNARMTFRQVENSSYQAILGCSIEDKRLNKREFILMSDDLYYGKSYDIN